MKNASDMTYSIDVSMGLLFPRKTVINKVKKFCFEQDLGLNVLESGFWMKDYVFTFKGFKSEKHRTACIEAIQDYFWRLQNI